MNWDRVLPPNLPISPLWIAFSIAGFVVLLMLMWWRLGRGPRRRRGLRRVHQRLRAGQWNEALERVRALRRIGRPSIAWKGRFEEAETLAREAAVKEALNERRYEEALNQAIAVVALRGQTETDARALIQRAMLEDLRRLYVESRWQALHDLARRTLAVQSPNREVSFWQALAHLREGRNDEATALLQTARGSEDSDAPATGVLDPSLYLGALRLRQGQAKDALRLFTEANRMDSNCPLVPILLGSALIATGGDTNLAVRALQRGLGPRGLQQWNGEPGRAWREGFPELRSYVRKLAEKYSFVCPLWGSDLQPLVRQGNIALGQGLYRLGQYQESADLFGKLLQQGAPSWAVLRGLGLALARLDKYDDAFKHLRTAHELEEPKDRITAGYLALCGAMGKPSQPEDKARNVAWAIQLVTRFNAPGDEEWADLLSRLFAEARVCDVPQSLDDQLYLCEHLASVHATDVNAAQAYRHLQASYPHAVLPEYAWLYSHAAQKHAITGDGELELFARTFAHENEARAYFAERQWDFEAIELAYLERAAERTPGNFPANLGPDYPDRGERLLLDRSCRQEQAGDLPGALATVAILTKLSPHNGAALDRLARLYYLLNEKEQAYEHLSRWRDAHPHHPIPLVRLGALFYEDQRADEARDMLRRAIELSEGHRRADLAFFAARLALHHGESADPAARDFLEECLHIRPDHIEALEYLALVRWLQGDRTALASQAASMDRSDIPGGRFHFCAALCHLASGHFKRMLESAHRMTEAAPSHDPSHANGASHEASELNLSVEAAYLRGLAYLGLGDLERACEALKSVAGTPASRTTSLAQAILGRANFQLGRHDEAVAWWTKLDAKTRASWNLAEPLAMTVFLSAIDDLASGRFEQAAEKFRSAGKLGCRDRRLGALLVFALFRAGQDEFHREEPAGLENSNGGVEAPRVEERV